MTKKVKGKKKQKQKGSRKRYGGETNGKITGKIKER